MQELSKVMFGQKNRLAVMLAIADSDGVFTPTELTQRLGLIHQSMIQSPLKDLQDAGLTRQKWPEEIRIVDELPRTPSGKIQKFVLRQRLRDGG